MADGAASPTRLHEDGIYLDLDMEAYVDDPAISGSGKKKLVLNAPDFKWELPKRNPLYKAPESDDRALGSLVHCAVLEGMDAFADRYFVAPDFDDEDPRLIRTADHAKAWLKERGEKCTGLKADLFERVRAQSELLRLEGAGEDELPIFIDQVIEQLVAQGNGRREKIKPRAFEYVALVERFVRSWPDACALLSEGLPEVSIFWTEGDVRYKSRPDWLSLSAILDVKKFGQPPRRGKSLRTQLQWDIVNYAYDIQAVHNHRAALQLPLLLDGGGIVSATGPNASARIEQLRAMAASYLETPPSFHWMFLRTPGPPQGLIMEFPQESERWDFASWESDQAIAALRRYREQCGHELDADKPWIDAGKVVWEDDDLPPYLMEIAR